jgi:alkylhydroperoxidase family enzyme
MPFIHWVEDDEASGELADIYQASLKTRSDRPQMPGILKCFSQRPDFLRRVIEFSNELHFSDGHLDRRTKEMIATLVSALNQCPY